MENKTVEGEIVSPVIDQALANFSPQDAAIAKLHEDFMPLRIDDLKDEKAIRAVHSARMQIKGYRIRIEKTRKDLKADALEYGRRVDSEAKRLTALLDPIEAHLDTEEGKVEMEKSRIKQEAERAKKKRLDDRFAAAQALGIMTLTLTELETMSDEEFGAHMKKANEAWLEQKRREIEANEKAEANRQILEAEERRLAEERRAIEEAGRKQAEAIKAETARLAAEQRKVDEERRAIEEEKTQRAHEQEIERARVEATDRARRDMEEKIVRDKVEAEEKAAREKEMEAIREARRPDLEKIRRFAHMIHAIEIPTLSDDARMRELRALTGSAGDQAHRIADALEAEYKS